MTIKQINKTTARRLFNEGKTFIMTPSNCSVESLFSMVVHPEWGTQTFDELYNNFCYYNCSYDTGYYPRFYIIEEE